jgi:hypothetical protein
MVSAPHGYLSLRSFFISPGAVKKVGERGLRSTAAPTFPVSSCNIVKIGGVMIMRLSKYGYPYGI